MKRHGLNLGRKPYSHIYREAWDREYKKAQQTKERIEENKEKRIMQNFLIGVQKDVNGNIVIDEVFLEKDSLSERELIVLLGGTGRETLVVIDNMFQGYSDAVVALTNKNFLPRRKVLICKRHEVEEKTFYAFQEYPFSTEFLTNFLGEK